MTTEDFKPILSYYKIPVFLGRNIVGYAILNYYRTGQGRKVSVSFNFKNKQDMRQFNIPIPLEALNRLWTRVKKDGSIQYSMLADKRWRWKEW